MARPKKTVTPKKRCINCSSEMVESSFYSDKNLLINNDDSGLCRACAIRTASEGMEGLHLVLQTLNRPFLPEIWDECGSNFEEYMKKITNYKKKYIDGSLVSEMTYKDSPGVPQVTDVNAYLNASDEDVAELADIFGDKFEARTLAVMNKELDNMIFEFGGSRESVATMDLYSEMIRLKYQARALIDKGDKDSVNTGKALLAELNKMKKDNKMTMSDIAEKKQDKEFSQELDIYEDEPIIPDKKFQDIHGIMFMMDYMVEQMLRFGNKSKKPVLEDYQEMKDYFDKNPSIREEIEQLDKDGE